MPRSTGYVRLTEFADTQTTSRAWAIEGTGSFGAGLTRHLAGREESVIELDRPARAKRRNGAKSDSLDAIRAAREALARHRLGSPRGGDHAQQRKSLSVLLTVRRSAVDAASDAQRQLFSLVIAAPEPIRDRFRGLKASAMPATVLCAWSHPGRIHSEAFFAMLAGAAPIPANSGQITDRYRLNRRGDRQLNRALHTITLSRIRHDQRTRDYVERRTAEGKTGREIKCCLKRYIARDLHRLLETGATRPLDTP